MSAGVHLSFRYVLSQCGLFSSVEGQKLVLVVKGLVDLVRRSDRRVLGSGPLFLKPDAKACSS